MFGPVNTNTDYTFTQSENRTLTTNTQKLIANYFGQFDVPKKAQSDKNTDDSQKTSGKYDLAINKNKDEEEKNEEINLLSNDDEDDEQYVSFYDGKASTVTNSFESLAAAVGASAGKVTENQLIAYLQTISADAAGDPSKAKEIAFIKSLIAKFDTMSGGENYITSFNGSNEPQDYETVTQEQVTSPISILI